jgi:predicted nucleic acid-binding protein
MKPASIYLETSVVSYLTSRPSRDTVTAARQTLTHEWWESVDPACVWVSELVLSEVGRGDPVAARKRLDLVAGLPCLPPIAAASALAQRLMNAGVVPRTEPEDATHIALACLGQATYLVTWNFSHFVGPEAKFKVFAALRDWGYTPPLLATPEELLEGVQR